jgi:P63C domain
MPEGDISHAAKSLSKLGSSKGGQKRAEVLSPQERSEIARNAVTVRWQKMKGEKSNNTTPWAVAEGEIKFLDKVIPCAVLDNGMRVLTQRGVLSAIGRSPQAKGGQGASKGGLPTFLYASNLRPFISDELILATKPIIYKPLSGGYSEQGRYRTIAFGCRADALSAICRVYVEAEKAGALIATQRHIATTAKKLLEALQNVAMIALVDEATGYQAVRAHDELQKILEAYVLPEHRPWVKSVPIEFTKLIYKLWGWDLHGETTQGPRYAGKLIRKYIYEQLPKGVLNELDRVNPHDEKWQRRHRHHQYLTSEIGIEHFKSQLAGVMTLMRASTSKQEFEKLFQRAYGEGIQGEFHFDLEQPDNHLP